MTNTNEARIETSTICNYKCKFCPHHTDSFTRKKEVMTLDTYKKIIDKLKIEAPQITEVTVSGFGEAFLDDTILDKIEYAKKNSYGVHVLTNGSLLNEKIIDKLFSLNVSDLRFSLHTIKIRPYFQITGQSKIIVDQILNIIHYAIENKENTEIIITVDVIDENRDHINEIIEYFKELNVTLEIWEPHNWANWGKYREGKIIKKTCGRPFNGPLQIQADGTVNMCCFDYNGELLLGDFLNQTLEEIFNSEPYLKIKKHHEEGTIVGSSLLCEKCDQLIDPGKDIVIYNNKFSKKERVGRTSTNYRSVL